MPPRSPPKVGNRLTARRRAVPGAGRRGFHAPPHPPPHRRQCVESMHVFRSRNGANGRCKRRMDDRWLAPQHPNPPLQCAPGAPTARKRREQVKKTCWRRLAPCGRPKYPPCGLLEPSPAISTRQIRKPPQQNLSHCIRVENLRESGSGADAASRRLRRGGVGCAAPHCRQ